MSVSGPESVRGRETHVLDFSFSGRVALAPISDHTTSWLEPERMAARRFRKREHSPISSRNVDVELFPEERRWETANGERGRSLSPTPLDELSFLYFVRTLPLEEASTLRVDHHYDEARNPVMIHVPERAKVEVSAGGFDAILVEMRVKDVGRFGGSGLVSMHLSDDERRIPVRIETSIPLAGEMVLSLKSWTPGGG